MGYSYIVPDTLWMSPDRHRPHRMGLGDPARADARSPPTFSLLSSRSSTWASSCSRCSIGRSRSGFKIFRSTPRGRRGRRRRSRPTRGCTTASSPSAWPGTCCRRGPEAVSIKTFFLVCVVVAGVFGAATVSLGVPARPSRAGARGADAPAPGPMRIGLGLGLDADPARSAERAARAAARTVPRPDLTLAFGSIRARPEGRASQA